MWTATAAPPSITIDRPKANAIDATTSKALGDAFAALDGDPDVRAIILTGAGPKFFSAGWDLCGAARSSTATTASAASAASRSCPTGATPVIAAVNGMAVGGGFEIAMAADLIVAADHAQFWLPEPALGILPDAGRSGSRAAPPHVAREMLLTGRRIGATEAAGWGLVNRVVPERRAPCRARLGRADRRRGTVGGRRDPRHRPTCGPPADR